MSTIYFWQYRPCGRSIRSNIGYQIDSTIMKLRQYFQTFNINYEIRLWDSHRCFSSECLLNIKTCLQYTNRNQNNMKIIKTYVTKLILIISIHWYPLTSHIRPEWCHFTGLGSSKIWYRYFHSTINYVQALTSLQFVELFSSMFLLVPGWLLTGSLGDHLVPDLPDELHGPLPELLPGHPRHVLQIGRIKLHQFRNHFLFVIRSHLHPEK